MHLMRSLARIYLLIIVLLPFSLSEISVLPGLCDWSPDFSQRQIRLQGKFTNSSIVQNINSSSSSDVIGKVTFDTFLTSTKECFTAISSVRPFRFNLTTKDALANYFTIQYEMFSEFFFCMELDGTVGIERGEDFVFRISIKQNVFDFVQVTTVDDVQFKSPVVSSLFRNFSDFSAFVNLKPRSSPCKYGYLPLEFLPNVEAEAKAMVDGIGFDVEKGVSVCLDYGKTAKKSLSVGTGSVLTSVNGAASRLLGERAVFSEDVNIPCGKISVSFLKTSPIPRWTTSSAMNKIAIDADEGTSFELYPNQDYQFKFSRKENFTYPKDSKVTLTYWGVKAYDGGIQDFSFQTSSTCEFVSRFRFVLTMRVLMTIAIFLGFQGLFFLFCFGGLWNFWKRFCTFFIIEGIQIPIYFGSTFLCNMTCGHCAIFRRNRQGQLQDPIPMVYLPGGSQSAIAQGNAGSPIEHSPSDNDESQQQQTPHDDDSSEHIGFERPDNAVPNDDTVVAFSIDDTEESIERKY
jgi:hypothetical protein